MSAGRSRSKPSRLFLRFGALAGLDVPLQRLHVSVNPGGVLRAKDAGREAQQPSELVIHLIDEPRRPILPLHVRIRPRSVQRAFDESAGALLRLAVNVLLHLELLFVTAKIEVIAIARPLAWGAVVEHLDLV